MSTSIAFTDAIGAATLTNGLPSPGDRFTDWTPISPPEESAVNGLGTGARHQWLFRQDYGASFSLDKIPVAELDVVMRLLRWLRTGGSVTVNTGDRIARSYTATAFPGWTIPEGPAFSDHQMLTYTLELKLKNTASADMLCNYSTTADILS
jgi:hypothetical protein